eukprot:CAMPEP_0114151216 /NCGR_PEP_ID=MMETSP0043_2-20121206/23137_1 /TAXON_ID=464988 /ORGANISM="Hemiselmis andersenii, Strain CCMP644" /LENGTH=109 /DNA_ID=CAMNT_0001246037 /DNA_START=40 /DNA_END=365 /DNA_ORIENTATION=+
MQGRLCRVSSDLEPTGKWRHHTLTGTSLRQYRSVHNPDPAREIDVSGSTTVYLHPPQDPSLGVTAAREGGEPSRFFRVSWGRTRLEFESPTLDECTRWVKALSAAADPP